MQQIEFLSWLQNKHSPALDFVVSLPMILGDERTYFILVPFLYWWINRKQGLRLLTLLFTSGIICKMLKGIFNFPRPFAAYPGLISWPSEITYSNPAFPSGHAQLAATFWIFCVLEWRNKKLFWIGLPLVFACGFSRLYFGMHWIEDVLAGVAIGSSWGFIFFQLQKRCAFWPKAQKWAWLIGALMALVTIGSALLIFHSTTKGLGRDLSSLGLGLLAISATYQWLGKKLDLIPKTNAGAKILLSSLGLAVLALFYLLTRKFDSVFFSFIASFSGTLWLTALFPFLMNRLLIPKEKHIE